MAHIKLDNDLPGIGGLMSAFPQTATHLRGLAQQLLRGESSLTAAEREAIATAVSAANECVYCTKSHAAATRHLGGAELLDSALSMSGSGQLSARMSALLVIAEKVRSNARSVLASDIESARKHGLDDAAIHDTVLIAAAFSMFNRYVDGLATTQPTLDADYELVGARLAAQGYVRPMSAPPTARTHRTPFGSDEATVAALESQMESLRNTLVAARAKAASRSAVKDYAFVRADGSSTTLAQLFDVTSANGHTDLLVIHNMGERCQYCALWADGLSAFASHTATRCALVLATPDSPESARAQILLRGWKMPVVCDGGTSFARDMGFEDDASDSLGEARSAKRRPGVSAFRRGADGIIRRTSAATFGPGDEFCAIWPLFELLEDGHASWQPRRPQ
jgi:uncharacterized peroxidase-related enzyme